jgi:hypothetical protein
MLASYRDFSFTALNARLAAGMERLLHRAGARFALAPSDVVAPLPDGDAAHLERELATLSAQLEKVRLATVQAVDAVSRFWVPVWALITFAAGFGFAFAFIGNPIGAAAGGLVFGCIGALGSYSVIAQTNGAGYHEATKQIFGAAVASHLSGFTYAATVEPDHERIRSWKLFPRLDQVRCHDAMTGTRTGRAVALMSLTVMYDKTRETSKNRKHRQPIGLTATCVVVETGPGAEGVTVIAPVRSRQSPGAHPGLTHGLEKVATGDLEFEAKYTVFSSEPAAARRLLDATMRQRIAWLPGANEDNLPFLIFQPGELVALVEMRGIHAPFTPPPIWIPLDSRSMLAHFASDLAVKHALLAATLDLGPSTTG